MLSRMVLEIGFCPVSAQDDPWILSLGQVITTGSWPLADRPRPVEETEWQ